MIGEHCLFRRQTTPKPLTNVFSSVRGGWIVIFIIPETRAQTDAEQMLRQYLGSMWQDEHRALVPQLIGYPGAFIREVAVYALTQCAYDDLTELSLDMLERSFNGLKEQLDARDDFLTKRTNGVSESAIHAN